MTSSVLLIHPPVTKPCEPPAGIARLAGACKTQGIHCRVWDASLGGILHLLSHPPETSRGHLDTWARRAISKTSTHLKGLRTGELYRNQYRYQTAVRGINRALQIHGEAPYHSEEGEIAISLSDYRSSILSAVSSEDLLRAAESCRSSLFYTYLNLKFEELISEETPDIVGISVNFMSQALCAFTLAGIVKVRLPRVRLVMGGGLITSWMRIPGFSNPFKGLVDDLVEGPGEETLLEILGVTPPENPLDRCPDFDFTEFPRQSYLAPGFILPYPASIGCYWRQCAFCPEKSECTRFQPRMPARVLSDLDQMGREFSPTLIHFLDNALTPRLLTHLQEYPPGTPWYGFARLTEHLADPDFVRGLRAAGCVMLKLGVESGSQKVLDALGKGMALSTASQGLQNLKSAGIATYVYLLFGTPAETPADAQETLNFTRTHASYIDFLNLAIFNLPAHCIEAQELETRDFYPGDLSLYREFRHPQGWNRDRVRRFLSREFKAHPAIRPILQRDPPFFSSNHAPLLSF